MNAFPCISTFDVVYYAGLLSINVIHHQWFVSRQGQFPCLRSISQILTHCDKWIFFNLCGTQISSFLTSSKHFKWFSVVVGDIFNLFAIYRRFNYIFDLVIINFSDSTRTLMIFEWKISRMEFLKPFLRCAFCYAIKLQISLCESQQFSCLYRKKCNMAKMFIFVLHIKLDLALTVVNKIMCNLLPM